MTPSPKSFAKVLLFFDMRKKKFPPPWLKSLISLVLNILPWHIFSLCDLLRPCILAFLVL